MCNMGMANANMKMNAHIQGVINEATSPSGKKNNLAAVDAVSIQAKVVFNS